ncbi:MULTISPECIES: hypothetical protein [Komagataeibacter]|uniref:Uncharacterized protein n=2 Tax=Komagataeibacter TaxID=1434011 RepID=A0A0D6Q998_KOMXY|nr:MULTISPECIES: hypothetical protein [Komagataeibacter]MBL7234850.1 hypothetical protein [Komagataeibacter oboediens]MBT0675620.1 hypothetical protein [Komagataeibacter oboediens]MBT0679113.1 hypothetical protein [Komagataeibacter oboediens]MBV0888176.1 hypothetical protein [Komagataeibacter oboediens]MBV1824446.1 hypothetical protein [Komagataeibacter oboediens]
MSETTGCTADWHLEHSSPGMFLHYLAPQHLFARQINTLTARFRDVQALCDAGSCPPALTRLRNALAFHLVKMSRWWRFDFCPRGVTGVRNPLFLTYVKAHAERSAEDDALFDLFTMQRHMHGGDGGHILVLGRDPVPDPSVSIVYGVDGQRNFRFATGSHGVQPLWNGQAYPDFAAAWLAARGVHALIRDDSTDLHEYETAQREHAWARSWHHRHFHRSGKLPVIRLYAQANAQFMNCQSAFGRAEMKTVVERLAFDIARAAFQRHMTVADLIEDSDALSINLRSANTIKQRARAYVATCIDPISRPEMDTLLDRVVSYVPRRCP